MHHSFVYGYSVPLFCRAGAAPPPARSGAAFLFSLEQNGFNVMRNVFNVVVNFSEVRHLIGFHYYVFFLFVFFPPSCHSECFVCFNRGIRDDGRKFNKTNKQKKADLKFENTTNFIFWGGGINYFFWVTLKDKPSLHRSFVIYCRTRKSSCWRNVDVKNLLFIYFGLHLYPDLYFLREKGGGGTST